MKYPWEMTVSDAEAASGFRIGRPEVSAREDTMKLTRTIRLETKVTCEVCGVVLATEHLMDAGTAEADLRGVAQTLESGWEHNKKTILTMCSELQPHGRSWMFFGPRWLCPKTDRSHTAFRDLAESKLV